MTEEHVRVESSIVSVANSRNESSVRPAAVVQQCVDSRSSRSGRSLSTLPCSPAVEDCRRVNGGDNER
jgi:hypothetical protein